MRCAAAELGYRPNPLARAMITGKSRLISLVVAYLERQFYPLALERLSPALPARGYHILVFLAESKADDVAPVVEELVADQVNGILIASVRVTDALAYRCEAADIPVVLFNRGQNDPRLSEVTSDNVTGGSTVANFLLAGRHRRIVHIAGSQETSTGRDRTRGFIKRLADHGLAPVAVVDGRYEREAAAAAAAARELFGRADEPDPIFVGNDHMAFAVTDVLRFELGLSVPADVSVVDYDDVPIAGWAAYDLTTIRQPVNRMVGAAVDALIVQIEATQAPHHIRIPGPLIIRGSARKPEVFRS